MNKNGGNLKRVFSHKSDLSKREKVKRLSEGTMSSDVEDELTRKKFKFPRKGFCDPIPRKLRSAISKRSYSVSKRPNDLLNVGPSPRMDCLKKSKTSMNCGSLPITKEEEEVAQTLFALAGMVPLKGESSESKTPGLARSSHADPMSSSEDDPGIQDVDPQTDCNQFDGSKKDSVQATPLIERVPLSCPKLSERRQLKQDLQVSVPPSYLQGIPPLLRACDGRGVNDPKIGNISFPLWQSQHFVDPHAVDLVANQQRDPLRGIELDGLPTKSSASVFPSWFYTTASSSGPGTCADCVSVDKAASPVHGTMKTRNRCISHVYISHLIKGMRISEGKDSRPSDQMRPSQSSTLTPNNNDLSGGFIGHLFGSTTNKNVCGISDRSTTGLRHHRDKEGGSKKQSFDFLSSTGSAVNANSGANRMNNCLGVNGQAPYLHSFSQASSSLPYSTPQTCFSFKAYQDQVAVASMAMPPVPPQVHYHQMPQYFANAFNPGHTFHTGTAKPAQLPQPKSQQQQIWTTQVAAQFRPDPLLSSHIASWQTRRQDPRISTQHILPSQPSKYLHISQQHQQQVIGCCPPQSGQRPSVCEDKGGRCQPDGVLPFQLLCNEQL